MDDATRRAVSAFKEELADLYGDRLDRVILFGSHARGDAKEASDVDLMVVLDGPVDRFEEIERMGSSSWEVGLEHRVF